MTTICGIRHPDKLLIGGDWVSPHAKGAIDLVSPETEQPFARVAEATNPDMDQAVAAARRAFDTGPWPRMTAGERVEALERLVAALQARSADLGEATRLQIGARNTHIAVGWGLQNFERAISLGREFQFEQRVPSTVGATAFVVYEPVGVVAAIAPWNSPFMIMAAKVAPALLAGCTVVMKPSPETPLEAYIIAECSVAVGLPAGVINLVTADREASEHLVRNPGVDKVSFTGSTAAGKRIAAICGERIARVALELGGKSAALIADDMPTEEAAKILAHTIVRNSGQVCAMLSRAIVPKTRHDELAAALASEMATIKIGYSDDADAELGPLAMKRQLERVEDYVRIGTEEGAALAYGGRRPKHLNQGYFIEPTLFTNVTSEMRIAQEEIFGPVLALMPCEDIEDGIRIANDSDYGLNGSVFSHDPAEIYRLAKRVRTGNISQSSLRVDFSLPFGGFKQSGIGREGGVPGLMAFLETKTIILDDATFEPASLAS